MIKKIGRAGEGPREFKLAASMNVFPGGLAVFSYGKISYYTRNGEYIKEVKAPLHLFPGGRILSNDLFVSPKKLNAFQKSICVYDSNFKEIKEIYREKPVHNPGGFFSGLLLFEVYGNKIFIVKGSEFQIGVFDPGGIEVCSISREYKRIKFSNRHKKAFRQDMQANPDTRHLYLWLKEHEALPDFFPAIANMFITDNKLYVQTYARENSKSEFFIFTLDGRLLDKIFLPIADMYSGMFFSYPYTISNGKLYQLIENEKTDMWEIHITRIENTDSS